MPTTVTLRLPTELRSEALSCALQRDETLSEFIRTAIERELVTEVPAETSRWEVHKSRRASQGRVDSGRAQYRGLTREEYERKRRRAAPSRPRKRKRKG